MEVKGYNIIPVRAMIYTIVLALFVFVCVLLILAVLLQNSKSSDIGSALGGGSGMSSDMFGPKAPSNIMSKITTVIAAAFLILSFILALMSGLGQQGSSLIDSNLMKAEPAKNTPAVSQPVTIPLQLDNKTSSADNGSSAKK